jgi:hypothetical protein
MRSTHISASLASAALLLFVALSGCSTQKPPRDVPHTAAPPVDVEQFRTMYRTAYPMARVGVVVATRPQDRLVAIGQTQPQDFAENQLVTFIDARQKVLDSGVVVRVLADQVHVRYDRPPAGGRQPREGDFAVKY